MRIVKNTVTDYASANFSETETLWTAPSTYTYADEARYGHFIYKYAGVTGTNTTDDPYTDSITVNPVWVNIRPSNYYAMLDGQTGTQTANTDTIVVELNCFNLDAFSLLEIEADEVTIELIDPAGPTTLYTKVFDLNDEASIIDFYTYCFSEFTTIPTIYTQDIPLYGTTLLKVTIDKTGSVAKCGRLVLGRSFHVGDTGYGANMSLESFSSKETDVFGNSTLVHRGSVNLDSYEVQVPTNKLPVLKRKAQELDAVPVLFVMDESEDSNTENLLTFGYWDNFSMMLPNPVKSTISLTIKGIV